MSPDAIVDPDPISTKLAIAPVAETKDWYAKSNSDSRPKVSASRHDVGDDNGVANRALLSRGRVGSARQGGRQGSPRAIIFSIWRIQASLAVTGKVRVGSRI